MKNFITHIVAVSAFAVFFVMPGVASAWGDSGCCEYSSPTYSDYSYSSASYDYSTPSYSDYSYSNASYNYSTPSYTDYSYSAPTYSYSTPSYSTDYSYSTASYDTEYSYSTPSYDTTYSYSTPAYDYSYTEPSYDYSYTEPSYDYTYTEPTYDYAYTTPTYTNYDYYNYTTTPYTYHYTPTTYVHTPPVVYVPPTTPTSPTPSCSINASRTSLSDSGYVTLSWSSAYATSASINQGVGSVDRSGSVRVDVDDTTTYRLTVRGAGGNTDCTVTVYVDEDDRDTDNDNDDPYCTLATSATNIAYGSSVNLAWSTIDARTVKLNQGIGEVQKNGVLTVKPESTRTYTLTANGNGGSDDCTVTVHVGDYVGGVTVDRIPLTAVPYTGFEAGPFLTTLFYILLGVWASLVAYFYIARNKKATVAVESATPVAAPIASTPVFTPEVVTMPIPGNLPTGATIPDFITTTPAEEVFTLSEYAAQQHVFVTDEVVQMVQASARDAFAQKAFFDALVEEARKRYPLEHGWITIDSTRATEILAK